MERDMQSKQNPNGNNTQERYHEYILRMLKEERNANL